MSEEVCYSTVKFYRNYAPKITGRQDEVVYAEVKRAGSQTSQTAPPAGPVVSVSTVSAVPKHPPCRLVAVCLGLSCVVLLTIIIALSVHYEGVIRSISEKYNSMSQSIPKQKDELDELRVNYSTLAASNHKLEADYRTLSTANQRLKAEHHTLSEANKKLQTDYFTLTMDKEMLESETQDLHRQENVLQRQKEDLEKEMGTCQLEKDDLQHKKQKLEDEIQKKAREFADALNELSEKCEIVDQYCPTANQPLQERLCQYCPQGWELFNSKCYYFSTDKLSWTDSRKSCKTQGANLLMIDSREEQEFFTNHPKKGYYWIGLSDSDKENYWTWVDNTVLITGYWSSPKLDGNRANNCAVININANSLNNWVDVGCISAHRRICETKALSFSM
nr:PREDICTED: C-type lectin domain family 4 member F-like isoform X1 [Lepisosteus oculatus]